MNLQNLRKGEKMFDVSEVLDAVGKIEVKMGIYDIQKILASVKVAFKIYSPHSGVKIVKVGDEKRWCVCIYNFENYTIPLEIPCVHAFGDTISQAMQTALGLFKRTTTRQYEDRGKEK